MSSSLVNVFGRPDYGSSAFFKPNRLCGLAVKHSLRDREVRGSISRRVKPGTLKLVSAAVPPSVWHYGFSVVWSVRCHDNVTVCGIRKHSLHHSVAARFNCPQRRL
ncbi:hypothetical protein ElyMa_004515800 [Elysia marginata]|uniref:Uncharacterized protein n=1 Tax=Elysia marginata TaxID=1093978 RepID=A0AAV4HM61_9GAST|nr:hypothetical protein ElyMa_004515800 [Elysia marginata]